MFSIDVTVGTIEIEKRKIREATELAMVLDDHQYFLCKEARKKNHDDPERMKIEKIRIAVIHIFSNLRVSLIAATSGIGGQKENLNQAIKDLRNFNRKVMNDVMKDAFPDKDDFEQSTPSGKTKPPKTPPEYPLKKRKSKKKSTKSQKSENTIRPIDERVYLTITNNDAVFSKESPEKKSSKIKSKSVSDAISISKLNEARLDESLWIKPVYQKFKEQNYKINFEEKIGKVHADMVLRKGSELIICEFKQFPEKIHNITIERLVESRKIMSNNYPADHVKTVIITPTKVSDKIRKIGEDAGIEFQTI